MIKKLQWKVAHQLVISGRILTLNCQSAHHFFSSLNPVDMLLIAHCQSGSPQQDKAGSLAPFAERRPLQPWMYRGSVKKASLVPSERKLKINVYPTTVITTLLSVYLAEDIRGDSSALTKLSVRRQTSVQEREWNVKAEKCCLNTWILVYCFCTLSVYTKG